MSPTRIARRGSRGSKRLSVLCASARGAETGAGFCDQDALVEAAKQGKRPRDVAVFLILRYSGMRRESVATLQVRHLDGQWGLRNVRVKGGKKRDIPLPSAAMAGALRAAAVSAGLANVTVIEAAWGEAPVRPHDLVLCAHVGGLLDGGSPFLREAGAPARRLVAFVRDLPAGPDDDKFFYRELYPALLGRPYEHRCRADDTVAGLERLGIHPAVTPIEYSSDQPFDSLEEACDFWMTYMGLEGPEPRDYLRRYLAGRLVRRGGEWIAPFRKRAAVIAWRPR